MRRTAEGVYEAFIEGAKEGFPVVVKIIPYLVAILVAVGMFRASGALDLLLQALAPVLEVRVNIWPEAPFRVTSPPISR